MLSFPASLAAKEWACDIGPASAQLWILYWEQRKRTPRIFITAADETELAAMSVIISGDGLSSVTWVQGQGALHCRCLVSCALRCLRHSLKLVSWNQERLWSPNILLINAFCFYCQSGFYSMHLRNLTDTRSEKNNNCSLPIWNGTYISPSWKHTLHLSRIWVQLSVFTSLWFCKFAC